MPSSFVGTATNKDRCETVETGAYFITRTPITNGQYAAFVAAIATDAESIRAPRFTAKRRVPDVDAPAAVTYGMFHVISIRRPCSRRRKHARSAAPFVIDRFFGTRRRIGSAADSICAGKE